MSQSYQSGVVVVHLATFLCDTVSHIPCPLWHHFDIEAVSLCAIRVYRLYRSHKERARQNNNNNNNKI